MNSKKHNKLQLLIRKIFDFNKENMHQPERMLSASKEHPIISTLVYKGSEIDFPTSETSNQDKLLINAKQVLASMDHTTASRH